MKYIKYLTRTYSKDEQKHEGNNSLIKHDWIRVWYFYISFIEHYLGSYSLLKDIVHTLATKFIFGYC